MKTYRVALARTYAVTVKARNEKEAMECAEFFLGDSSDSSTPEDRKEHNFSIEEIEMVYNDAVDAEEFE